MSPYKLGGAFGGSEFDPRGKSDNEVHDRYYVKICILTVLFDHDYLTKQPFWQIMRFCQSFMNELYRYMGPDQVL